MICIQSKITMHVKNQENVFFSYYWRKKSDIRNRDYRDDGINKEIKSYHGLTAEN